VRAGRQGFDLLSERQPPSSYRYRVISLTYHSGEWDDAPGKLSLLYDLERVRQLVRGSEPFDPAPDHAAFARFLVGAQATHATSAASASTFVSSSHQSLPGSSR
jgi:hypothetical protein